MALLTAAFMALAGLAVTPAPVQAGQDVVVNPKPDQKQPRILNGRVYGIDSSGPLVVVGGSFTSIRNGAAGAPDQTQQWLFMFNSTTGQIVSSFAPQLRGPDPDTSGLVGDRPGVQSVQFAADGQSVYVAGDFTEVNGASRKRIVRLALDGSIISSFNASANGVVNDLALVGNRLIVAGRFGQVNDRSETRLASLDPVTGANQADFNLPITESRYEFATYVQEIDASEDGKWLVVAGNFERVGAVNRNQLALINLQGTPSVANWSTDAYAADCNPVYDDSWIRGVDISDDSSYLVVSTTGAHQNADSLCDSAARWELPPTSTGDGQRPTWRTLTGGDTFWASEITDSAVYVGGHQRWVNNAYPAPRGDFDGPGAVERFGIVALDPASGVPLSWNPSRDRGRGAEALHATDTNLFIGSDTDFFNNEIRQRLAVLGVAGGKPNPQPVEVRLPVNLNITLANGNLRRVPFDGQNLGAVQTVSGPGADGINWSSLRDGFVQNGKVHYFGGANAFYSRPFSNTAIGAETNLSTSVGYIDLNSGLTPYGQPYGVAETDVATYDNGRIYAVKTGDGKLYSRGYSLESGIIDSREEVASGRDFGNARALDFIGGFLYAAWSDGRLYRFPAPNGRVQYDNQQLVDSGQNGINWAQVGGMFSTPGTGAAVPPTTPVLSCSGGTPWTAEFWSNTDLQGAPDNRRCEADAGAAYQLNSPSGTTVGPDNFSVRWTRQITLAESKSVEFTATADDGVRVFVDGERIIDNWVDAVRDSPRTGTSKALAAGTHTLRVEFYEELDGAYVETDYRLVDPLPVYTGPDTTPAETTVSAPSQNQTLASSDVRILGGATDDRNVSKVRVGIFNRADTTNRWLQADGTFGPDYATRRAVLASAEASSTTWSLDLTLPDGSYAVDAVAVDGTGNADPSSAYRPFTVKVSNADTEKPGVEVASPAQKSRQTSRPVTVSGTATDDQAVSTVQVAVYNQIQSKRRWLQPNGAWGRTRRGLSATLGTPGAAATTWSLPIDLPSGSYGLDVRAKDSAGKESAAENVSFTVRVADNVAPQTAVKSAPSGTTRARRVKIKGFATDDQAVRRVEVKVVQKVVKRVIRQGKVKKKFVKRFLRANGKWGSKARFVDVNVFNDLATRTGWVLKMSLPKKSSKTQYIVRARAVDANGNKDRSPAKVRFSAR
ncbi:hypothetical protein GCM10027020_38040 [Nocardioides salsibiostraticola]